MRLSAQLLHDVKAAVGQGPQSLQVQDGPRTVQCELVQSEPLAATLTELRLDTAELAGVSMSQLEAASRDLTSRVTYLLEPIAPIEIDADSCTVQMRSNPPQQDDNGCRYYELLLRRGGSASLCR